MSGGNGELLHGHLFVGTACAAAALLPLAEQARGVDDNLLLVVVIAGFIAVAVQDDLLNLIGWLLGWFNLGEGIVGVRGWWADSRL